MDSGAPETTHGGAPKKFDIETLRDGIEAKDAASLIALYAPGARLTLVDGREQPSHPFQIAGKAAIRELIDELCGEGMAHNVEQVVVSEDGSHAAYLERCRLPDGTKMITTSMLDLREEQIVSQVSLQARDKPERGGPTTAHAKAAAEHVGDLDFARAEEVNDFTHGRVEILNLRGGAVGRFTLEPRWRWSRDVKPLVRTEWCEKTHFLYHLSGTLHFRMADGTECSSKPGDATLVPPRHDAWVAGNEPVIVVDWRGAAHYGEKRGGRHPE